MSQAEMDQTMYCAVEDVVCRILMKEADITGQTEKIEYAIVEASRVVDTFLKPYTTVPLEEIPDQIVVVTADFAASVFKRRYVPSEVRIRGPLQPDMISDIDGTGWFALGYKKLQEYIKNFYTLGQGVGVVLHNPDVFLSLMEKGLLTPMEARKLINDENGAVIAHIDAYVKTQEITTTETITRTVTEYPTKKQKSFGFTSGKTTTLGGYVKDE